MNNKRNLILIILFLLMINLAYAYVNPATDLCLKQGNEYSVETNDGGSQTGYCIVDGDKQEVWGWYTQIKKSPDKVSRAAYSLNENNLNNEIQLKNKSLDYQKINKNFQSLTKETSVQDITNDNRGYVSPTLDWRDNSGNWVSPIKDQGLCGSCWAFAANGVMESRVKIDLNLAVYNVSLSEQDAITNNEQGGSCDGGWDWYSFDYAKNTGIIKESCMPYNPFGSPSKCANWQNEKMMLTDYAKISATETAIKNAISNYGPITVYLIVCDDFGGTDVYSHTGDVYYDGSCYSDEKSCDEGSCELNMHNVDIVGYDDNNQYWIIKNSWGTGWGNSGYLRVAYSQSAYSWGDWVDSLLSESGDSRVFFFDESYYLTGTDTPTIPTINSFSSNNSYAHGTDNLTFSANVIPKSIKRLLNVTLNGTNMSGTITGGVFTISKTPSTWGCQNIEGYCNLLLTAIDDAGKLNTEQISIRIDDINPRVSNFTINNSNYYLRNQSLLFTVNVTDADVSSVKINNVSLYLSDGLYRIIATPYELGVITSGPFQFNVTAIDALGNINYSDEIPKDIDYSIPVINSINISDYIVRNGTNVSIIINATDEDTEIINVFIEGIQLTFTDDLFIGNISLNSPPFNITVRDMGGNLLMNNSINYTIDDTSPVIYGSWLSDDYVKNNTNVTIYINISDENLSRIGNLKCTLINCAGSVGPIGIYSGVYSTNVTLTVDTISRNLTIWDEADNYVHIGFVNGLNFTIDDTVPNITLTSPQNNSMISVNYTWINFTTNEESYCYLNGTNTSANYTVSHLFYYDLYDDANYTYYYNCSDRAENSNALSIYFWVNITYPPVIDDVIDITVNETDLINITINASDADNDTLSYFINNDEFTNSSNNFSWLTNTSQSGVYNLTIRVSDGIYNSTENFTLTILDVPDKDHDNIPDSIDLDNDNDGVNDTDDTLLGAADNIATTTLNISLKIDDNETINSTYDGEKSVVIYNNATPIMEFLFNFTNSTLDLYNITINKQTNSSAGLLTIIGLALPQNQTKTVYVDKLNSTIGSVCVKDSENISISDLCILADEYAINCPGTNNGYTCSLINSNLTYNLSGLHHSTVREQTYCGDGLIQSGESCDTSNLNGKTCITEGFDKGDLSCTSSCVISTSGCSNNAAPSGGSGGGGGGGAIPEISNLGNLTEKGIMTITGEKYAIREITVRVSTPVVNARLFVEEKQEVSYPLNNGTIYKYAVLSGSIGDSLKNATIKYRVSNAWLKMNSFEDDEILFFEYKEAVWQKSPQTVINKDTNYTYYSADVKSIGTYAISSVRIIKENILADDLQKENVKSNISLDKINEPVKEINLTLPEEQNSKGKKISLALIAVIVFAVILVIVAVSLFIYLKKQDTPKFYGKYYKRR